MEGRADFMKLRYTYRLMRVDDGYDPHGTCHGNIEHIQAENYRELLKAIGHLGWADWLIIERIDNYSHNHNHNHSHSH